MTNKWQCYVLNLKNKICQWYKNTEKYYTLFISRKSNASKSIVYFHFPATETIFKMKPKHLLWNTCIMDTLTYDKSQMEHNATLNLVST